MIIRTEIWTKEKQEIINLIINLVYLNIIFNIIHIIAFDHYQSKILLFQNVILLIFNTIIIISYNKHKKEKRKNE